MRIKKVIETFLDEYGDDFEWRDESVFFAHLFPPYKGFFEGWMTPTGPANFSAGFQLAYIKESSRTFFMSLPNYGRTLYLYQIKKGEYEYALTWESGVQYSGSLRRVLGSLRAVFREVEAELARFSVMNLCDIRDPETTQSLTPERLTSLLNNCQGNA